MPRQAVDDLAAAVSEVLANGLIHGRPPVRLVLWAELTALTCQVVDSGPGGLDLLSGYRHPGKSGSIGLWVARQLVDELVISDAPGGGCGVLLTKS